MTELEDRLRAMLHERAADIGGTAVTGAAPTADADIATTRHTRAGRHRPRAWLLSAAALVVVATGAGALLVSGDGTGSDRAATGSPTADRTSSRHPAPRSSDPVALDELAPDPVARYTVRATGAFRDYRDVAWHRSLDLGRASRTNTGSAASVQAVVLDSGRFSPGTLLTGGTVSRRIRIDGVTGYVARLRQFREGRAEGPDALTTIAWQFAADRWAVVQKITDLVTFGELEQLANALHPDRTVPVTVPFTLRNVPPGRLLESSDNRQNYPQTLVFGNGTTTTRIQIHPKADRVHPREDWIAHYVSGLAGYLDPQNGGYVEYAGGILTISAEKNGGELDTAVVKRIFAGLRWSGGDGSGPGVPLADALGG